MQLPSNRLPLRLLSTGTLLALSYALIAVLKNVKRRRRSARSAKERDELLAAVSQDPEFDVIIVGGGAFRCSKENFRYVLTARFFVNLKGRLDACSQRGCRRTRS